MNKDKVKGKANQVVGEARKRAGHAVGNDELEAAGQSQELKGKGQSVVGELKDGAHDVEDKLKKAF